MSLLAGAAAYHEVSVRHVYSLDQLIDELVRTITASIYLPEPKKHEYADAVIEKLRRGTMREIDKSTILIPDGDHDVFGRRRTITLGIVVAAFVFASTMLSLTGNRPLLWPLFALFMTMIVILFFLVVFYRRGLRHRPPSDSESVPLVSAIGGDDHNIVTL